MKACVHGYPRHYRREAHLNIGAVRSNTLLHHLCLPEMLQPQFISRILFLLPTAVQVKRRPERTRTHARASRYSGTPRARARSTRHRAIHLRTSLLAKLGDTSVWRVWSRARETGKGREPRIRQRTAYKADNRVCTDVYTECLSQETRLPYRTCGGIRPDFSAPIPASKSAPRPGCSSCSCCSRIERRESTLASGPASRGLAFKHYV